jgi:predicted regulator of amino acid metabolism with ACT domain
MSTITNDSTNPGLVDVASQSDGEIKVNQTITTGPSSNAGPTISVITERPIGHGISPTVQVS